MSIFLLFNSGLCLCWFFRLFEFSCTMLFNKFVCCCCCICVFLLMVFLYFYPLIARNAFQLAFTVLSWCCTEILCSPITVLIPIPFCLLELLFLFGQYVSIRFTFILLLLPLECVSVFFSVSLSMFCFYLNFSSAFIRFTPKKCLFFVYLIFQLYRLLQIWIVLSV